MKTLLFETKEIILHIERNANRPVGINSSVTGDDSKTFKDIIVAWLCIEKDDNILDANNIITEIEKYHKMVAKKVIVIPFFHLSSNASLDENFNKAKIDYICKSLYIKKVLEGQLGYGFHRAIYSKWITFGHFISTAYRDSKFSKTK
jgi:hypothetical protein